MELEIDGMSCEACAGVIKNSLMEAPGVAEAEVDYPTGHAVVRYDAAKTDPAKLVEAVKASGYQAALAASRKE